VRDRAVQKATVRLKNSQRPSRARNLKKRNGSLSPNRAAADARLIRLGPFNSAIFSDDTLNKSEMNAPTPSHLAQIAAWPPYSRSRHDRRFATALGAAESVNVLCSLTGHCGRAEAGKPAQFCAVLSASGSTILWLMSPVSAPSSRARRRKKGASLCAPAFALITW
jgi:hypothetical protein